MALTERQKTAVALAVVLFLAALSTVFRVIHRIRRSQLWWDDLWAGIASIATAYAGILLLANGIPPGGPGGKWPEGPQAAFIWTGFFTSTLVVWSSRLSIQATVVYVLSPGNRNRVYSKWAMWALGTAGVFCFIAKIFYAGLPLRPIPAAPWPKGPAIVNIVFNAIGSIWLVSWPAYLLLQMGLRKRERKVIMAGFSMDIILMGVDIWHAYNIIMGGAITMVSGHIELLFSCIAANLLVFTTYIYRAVRRREEADREAGESSTDKTTTESAAAGSQSNSAQHSNVAMSNVTSSVGGHLTTIYDSDGASALADSSLGMISSISNSHGPIQIHMTDSEASGQASGTRSGP